METITLELPRSLYMDLQALAEEEDEDLVALLSQWVQQAHQRQAWLRELRDLRNLIQREGGLDVGDTKEEVVAQMRKTRQEIFEAEYAHLYR